MPGVPDPEYVRARRVLLDALEALREHRNAIVLVGAQAIYLHTGEEDLAVAPHTTDADIALNPRVLADEPELAALLQGAGFVTAADSGRIGTWVGRDGIPVDLLVPEAIGGPGRRSAELGAHGNRVARKGRGLEAALIDNLPMVIESFESSDTRRFEVSVAGPSALLVAKIHKILDRQRSPSRLEDKDALDIYRLLRALPTETFRTGIEKLLNDPLSRAVADQALEEFETLFSSADDPAVTMVIRSLERLEDPATTAAACVALAEDLLTAVRRRA
jgi:hypothetical protein